MSYIWLFRPWALFKLMDSLGKFDYINGEWRSRR